MTLDRLLYDVPALTWASWLVAGALAVWLKSLMTSPSSMVALSFFGVVGHELAHYLVGFICGAKPQSISLIPEKQSDGSWVLGTVSFSNLTWWNSVPTAMAPLLLLPLAMTGLHYAIPSALNEQAYLLAGGEIFLAAVCMHAAWPSSTDIAAAAPGLFILGLVWWAFA